MCLDSSPPTYCIDTRHANSSLNFRDDSPLFYEPARIPFYSASSSLQDSSGSRDALETRTWRQSNIINDAPLGQASYVPSSLSASASFNSVHPLPTGVAQARFLSDIPTIDDATGQRDESSLPPSESPSYSWAGHTSRFYDSDEIPQASFSLSPPANSISAHQTEEALSDACDAGYCSADASVYSLLNDALDHDASSSGPANDDPARWEQICLFDLLNGALFEDADPWRALDDILDLPPLLVSRHRAHREPESAGPADVSACDPSGVGYILPDALSPCPSTTVWPIENGEALRITEDEHSMRLNSIDVVFEDPIIDRSGSLLDAGGSSRETLLHGSCNDKHTVDGDVASAVCVQGHHRDDLLPGSTSLPASVSDTSATSRSELGRPDAQQQEPIAMSCTVSAAERAEPVRPLAHVFSSPCSANDYHSKRLSAPPPLGLFMSPRTWAKDSWMARHCSLTTSLWCRMDDSCC
ncbi:hypothetical protein BC628DRAFT_1532 [Trametes gibbosa]|nr:hypothetical protein BC628DRAFT_1532 [Trametes gibbosa]